MSTTQPIRNKNQVRELASYYLVRGELRNHLLIVIGVHTALRISDLLRLTWDDVYDFDRNCFHKSITITEKKTGKAKTVALNNNILAALRICEKATKRGDFLFASRKGRNRAISRIQAYRIIRAAADALAFAYRVSCHSLRKTFGYHLWKSGISSTVIMEIYNHSNYAVTRRYLGVCQDDKNEAYWRLAKVL